MMATILIVEDDILTNENISEYLKDAGHKVISAFDGNSAIQIVDTNTIDIILLDIMLPQVNGLTVLKEVRKNSNVPVLMLTAMSDEDTQIASFDGLADDYITKPFSMVLLGKRVTALLRRSGKCDPPNLWRYEDVTVDFSGFCAEKSNVQVDISPKEILLLKLLVEHKGIVLTREQILDKIWGEDIPLSDRTIDTYIGRIRKKLGIDCILTIKGVGYKFEVRK